MAYRLKYEGSNILDIMIGLRRSFHALPELGWGEFTTTARIAGALKDLGYSVYLGTEVINNSFVRGREMALVEAGIRRAKELGVEDALLDKMGGYTGCMGVLDTKRPGKTTALRFDIDCVGVDESKDAAHIPNIEGFSTDKKGAMHACGHDGHMAIGLGVAKFFAENIDRFSGRLKLIFQPAEEGVRGAIAMRESGIVDDADYFLGMHLGFIAKSGEVVIDPVGFLCTTKLDFFFKGTPAHAGAAPELGRNALGAASEASLSMLAIARHGEGSSRINIGYLRAGEGRNVIPATAYLQAEVRGENEAINTYMKEAAIRCAKGAALTYGVEVRSEIVGEAVDLVNDKKLVEVLGSVVDEYSELTKIEQRPFGGSEDATLLARRVQENGGKALYFIVGSDITAGHHKSGFDLDERSLEVAYNMLTGCLEKLMPKA